MRHRYKYFLLYISMFVLPLIITSPLSAYEIPGDVTADFINESKGISQGDLAIILVRSAGLESELPVAPLKDDYIKLLSKKGIRPLEDWDANRMLTSAAFAVILVRAMGLEKKIISIQEACDMGREYINKIWQIQYGIDGYHKTLNDLLNDKRFFPQGPPEGPLGHKYVDKDGDHRVDFIEISPGEELQPSVRYIYTLETKGIVMEGSPANIVTLKAVKAALLSPVFRSAPTSTFAAGLKEETKEKAEEAVTPITPGGP